MFGLQYNNNDCDYLNLFLMITSWRRGFVLDSVRIKGDQVGVDVSGPLFVRQPKIIFQS